MDTMLNPKGRDLDLTLQGQPYLVTGAQEIWQRIFIRLATPRGAFAPDPTLGSRLYRLPRGSREEMNTFARGAIEEATAPIAGLRLKTVECSYDPREDKAQVDCVFLWAGEELTMELEP